MAPTVSCYGMGSMMNDVGAVGDIVAGKSLHRGTIDVLLGVLEPD